MNSFRLSILLWVCLIHLAGIYLFTSGFLLTRLSLSNFSTCSNRDCKLPSTHKRAVLLIIDALRFDFIAPNPPKPLSPFHHGILTLPRELTATRPRHSVIFNAYADPPTTTLQRIKGITTGSLPTFVDIGNNFGGTSIEEDSLLKQLKMEGKKMAFMGDDTWMSVFPDAFETNMTFPYDSFNVEDLHTVDEGVIRHLFPLLQDPSKPFDFLVGHFLGVDHVGHRVGPDHPSMKAKLQQMNNVLTRVVEFMDEDTILVVLGDHGMDRSGDHGGDGMLETSSGMWVYSKGAPLMDTSYSVPSGLLQFKTFPGADTRHRSIQQIDILPTLSLILGLPIPYNNLGTIIPELFWRDREGKYLEKALRINAAQIMAYLNTYRSSPSGGELDEDWKNLLAAWNATQAADITGDAKLITLMNFNRVALAACRAMWAQFNPLLMALGLSLLSASLCAVWSIYSGLSASKNDWDNWLRIRVPVAIQALAGGAAVGIMAHLVLKVFMPGISALDFTIFTGFLVSSAALIVSSPPTINLESVKSTPLILIIHTISFFSNSFTFWEDRIVPFLLITSTTPFVLTGLAAPNSRLRYRILGFSALFAGCVRLMSISTICREEQQPYCHVTFFASSSLPSPPVPVLYLAIPMSFILPFIVTRFLRITRSYNGLAQLFFPLIFTPSLVGGSVFWIMEWADSASVFDDEWTSALRIGRTIIARVTFGWIFVAGGGLWWLVPLCLKHVRIDDPSGKGIQAGVLGHANVFGAPYLIFWSISLSLVFFCTQLTGQLVLALATIALIAYLEVLDSVRDVKGIEAAFTTAAAPSAVLDPISSVALSPTIQFVDIVPIALLGLHTFYATGHQAVISSLQWKSAFLLTPTVTYPFSVVTVVLNSIGPVFLFALAAPLAALWNRAPLSTNETQPQPHLDSQIKGESTNGTQPHLDLQIKGESTLTALSFMIYYSALLLGTSASAAILRRHLMVWKVFAPRFMLAVLELLAVDAAILIGVGIGVERVANKVVKVFEGAAFV